MAARKPHAVSVVAEMSVAMSHRAKYPQINAKNHAARARTSAIQYKLGRLLAKMQTRQAKCRHKAIRPTSSAHPANAATATVMAANAASAVKVLIATKTS